MTSSPVDLENALNIARAIEHRLTALEEQTKDFQELKHEVHDLLLKFNKYEGRWGTIVMIGAALWAIFATFKDQILAMIKGN